MSAEVVALFVCNPAGVSFLRRCVKIFPRNRRDRCNGAPLATLYLPLGIALPPSLFWQQHGNTSALTLDEQAAYALSQSSQQACSGGHCWSSRAPFRNPIFRARVTALMAVITDRMTARMEGDFCVFLIGMRINRPLKIHKWLPLMRAMPKMLRELADRPEFGFLGSELWLGRTVISLQYWRSAEDLIRFASAKDMTHAPAWAAFTRNVGNSGDVGIWHETYMVAAGNYETIYHNMPPFGLGRIGTLVSATGSRAAAKGRFSSMS